jgi:hypothetical protein
MFTDLADWLTFGAACVCFGTFLGVLLFDWLDQRHRSRQGREERDAR